MNELILTYIYLAISPLWLAILIVTVVFTIKFLKKLINDRKYKVKGTSNKNTIKYAALTTIFGLSIIAVLLVPNFFYKGIADRLREDSKDKVSKEKTPINECISSNEGIHSNNQKSDLEYLSYYANE